MFPDDVHVIFNSMKEEIVHIAIDNLQRVVPMNVQWKPLTNRETDGKLELRMAGKKVMLHAIVMKDAAEEQLGQIYKLAYKHPSFIVIAQKISPKIKMILRQIHQAYLEGDGSIFLFQKSVCLLVDRHSETMHSLPVTIPEIKSTIHLIPKENF
jgi:hypothetical protein